MMFGVCHHTTLIVSILFKSSIFPTIGKNNNHSSVSDADREITIRGKTDNAGNEVLQTEKSQPDGKRIMPETR